MRVTVGMPVYDTVKADTLRSLVSALLTPSGISELHFAMARGCYIAEGREEIVRQALAAQSQYLVFIDTDMVFPVDGIARLLAHRKDIVGGNYHEKRFPLTSTVKMYGPDGETYAATSQADFPTVPFRCAAVATGFMAINLKRMVECLSPPFFCYHEDLRGGYQAFRSGPGEDTAFCRRAGKAGMEVWCDPTIDLGHVGELIYGLPHD